MVEVARDQAVQKLVQEVPSLRPDDLAEVFNELFPTQPTTEQEAKKNRTRLLDRVTEHIRRGLQAEEIVALWPLVFPTHWNVVYNDETNSIEYREEAEPAEYAD